MRKSNFYSANNLFKEETLARKKNRMIKSMYRDATLSATAMDTQETIFTSRQEFTRIIEIFTVLFEFDTSQRQFCAFAMHL